MKSLSLVWLFTTPWTVAYKAPLSMEFSRQEYFFIALLARAKKIIAMMSKSILFSSRNFMISGFQLGL